jgi:hypothetical protein
MKNKLTLSSVRATLAPLGLTIRKTPHAEFLVRIKGSPAGHGYFTNDLQDALDTGKHMAKTGNSIQI